jgi:hypothetical protein
MTDSPVIGSAVRASFPKFVLPFWRIVNMRLGTGGGRSGHVEVSFGLVATWRLCNVGMWRSWPCRLVEDNHVTTWRLWRSWSQGVLVLALEVEVPPPPQDMWVSKFLLMSMGMGRILFISTIIICEAWLDGWMDVCKFSKPLHDVTP